MAYNNLISRSDADALIPIEVTRSIIEQLPEQSAALRLFRNVRMSSKQTRMPVLSALPQAYFVNGDTGLKQTTEVNWTNKYLDAETVAVIVPVPEEVLDDAEFDILAEVKPKIVEAIGKAVDAAIFFGTNKPSSWPTAIVPAAIAAGNAYARGTADAVEGGIAEDINQLMGLVEGDGFDVNGFVTNRSFRSRLRGARATDGQKLLDVSLNTLEGEQVVYAMRGGWPSTGDADAEMIAGDFTQGIVGIRQDITYKLLTEGVIQDNTGAIVLNLPQQDAVALRVVFRVAFQVANPLTHENGTNTRYPFAVLTSPDVA